jgi:pyruvate dehydrogenase E1 component beta subunit
MFGGKAKTPVVIRTQYGAGYRTAAQHSQSLYPLFAHVPGLKVVIPSTAYDAKGLLISSVRDDDPVVFFEHKVLYDEARDHVPEAPYAIPFGEANFVREGEDVTIVAIGRMVHVAKRAADKLAQEKIEVELIDPRTISPLDEDSILESVEKTGRLVVVDEAHPRCGMAADIAALVADKAFKSLKAPVKCVTAPHTPVPFSPVLEDAFIPSDMAVAAAARTVMA